MSGTRRACPASATLRSATDQSKLSHLKTGDAECKPTLVIVSDAMDDECPSRVSAVSRSADRCMTYGGTGVGWSVTRVTGRRTSQLTAEHWLPILAAGGSYRQPPLRRYSNDAVAASRAWRDPLCTNAVARQV